MTPRQTAMYFSEWGRVRDVLIARGIDRQQIESRRHQLHKQALGQDKSSKEFTNADLDRVLAAFLSITEPDNLQAQLRLIEQPEKRRGRAQALCHDLVHRLPQIKDSDQPSFYADNYLDQLARRVRGVRFEQLDEAGLFVIHGILKARIEGKEPKKQMPGDLRHAVPQEEDSNVPF